MIADAVAPAVTRNPYGDHESREGLLVAFGGGNTSGSIDVSTALTALTAHGHRIDFEVETFVAHSLRGEGYDASEDGTGRGTPLVPVCIHSDAIGRSGDAKTPSLDAAGALRVRDPGIGIVDDGSSYNLMSNGQPHAIAWSIMPQNSGKDYKARQVEVAQPLMSGGPVGGNQGGDFIQQAWAVRRLMPIECERLQGFPDNFTNVPWRGKDTAPDGPRYKALGNSMACNAMRWIGQRIDIMEKLTKAGRIAA